jgi:DNA-directed RNA polymerase specialized sigma24 family protein
VNTSEQGEVQDTKQVPLKPAYLRATRALSGRSGPVSADEVAAGLSQIEAEEARQAADRLKRRIGDSRLLARLSENGFEGIEYEIFADDLARYAIPVLRGWMYSGYIFFLAAKRGYRLAPSDAELDQLRRDSALRDELAIMTVAKALRFFRSRALLAGGWTVDGGASLTTYFTGSCVFVFPNEFRRHRRTQQRWREQDLLDNRGFIAAASAAQDPAGIVAGNLWVEGCLDQLDERARAIVELRMDDYSQAEIVEMLGETSIRAIEGVLYRLRTGEMARLKRKDER